MTRPFLLLENASLKEHPINLPLRDGPSGAEALTASGGEGASIAQMYICALAGVNPFPQCRLRAELLGKRAESPPLCRKVWQQCQNSFMPNGLVAFSTKTEKSGPANSPNPICKTPLPQIGVPIGFDTIVKPDPKSAVSTHGYSQKPEKDSLRQV